MQCTTLIVSGKGRKGHEHNHCHIGMVMGLEWVCDPDPLYVLAVDNVGKILVIHEIQVWYIITLTICNMYDNVYCMIYLFKL